MAREDFVCAHRLRVRWAEVDMQKIVFNGHYLTYIDTAIADYWREIGLPYPHGYVERFGNDVYLRKATVEYLGSARYDDELEIRTMGTLESPVRVRFNYRVVRVGDGALLASGHTVHAALDRQRKPRRLPERVRAVLQSGRSPR